MNRFDVNVILGMAALDRLDFVVDGLQSKIYLRERPLSGPQETITHNRMGAVFAPRAQDAASFYAHVVEGSPADEAGVRDGDVLLSINELDVTTGQTDDIVKISKFTKGPAGTAVELKLRRGEEEFEAKVILRNLLPPDLPAE